jgi:hypothetical protein
MTPWGRPISAYYEPGLWGVDPNGPSDTREGLRVADDVASTLVRLDLADVASTLVRLDLDKDVLPRGWSRDAPKLLGWSSGGTELLFTPGRFEEYLYILHADGSITRVNAGRALNPNAAISPDGSRVVCLCDGFNIVDADGGSPQQLPYPGSRQSDDGEPDGGQPKEGEPLGPMTFSPDGTQIAYLVKDGVWVVNADGTDAHEIVANEATRNTIGWFSGLQWSPAGDRLAIGLGHDGRRPAIYTFAPDGSDFTRVITGGRSPYWSPDGSQIAYTIPCEERPTPSCPEGTHFRSGFDPQPGDSPAGLAIADAGGSNVRAFGFAASGPWLPGG